MAARPSARFFEMARGHCLQHDVAKRGGLHGTGDDQASAGIGCELVEQPVLTPAAYDAHRGQARARDAVGTRQQLLQRVDNPAVAQRQAFEAAAHDLAHRLGYRLVRAPAKGANRINHAGGLKKVRGIGVNDAS